MRIVVLVEGGTERVFKPFLSAFLRVRLAGKMPKIDFRPHHGRIPTGEKLRRIVDNHLNDAKQPADAVVALTDVYTGTQPPDFSSAEDAKRKMREWVGAEPRFFPHVALHDFEAWRLPYWSKIKKLAGSNRKSPSITPEKVNHGKPPAHLLNETFPAGSPGNRYSKILHAQRILTGEDLMIAVRTCPELKAFVNTLIECCDPTQVIP